MNSKVCGNYTDSIQDTLQIIYIGIDGKLILSKTLLDMVDAGASTLYSLNEYNIRDIQDAKKILHFTNDTYIILLECGEILIISKEIEITLLNFINAYTNISQVHIINFTTLLFLIEEKIIIYHITDQSTYQIQKVECTFSIKSIIFHDEYSSECIIIDSLNIRRAYMLSTSNKTIPITIIEIPELSEFIENSCKDEEILSIYSCFNFNILIIYTLSNKIISTVPYTILPYSRNYSLIVVDVSMPINMFKICNSSKQISKIYNICLGELYDYQKIIKKLMGANLEIGKLLDLNDINIEDTYETLFDNWSIRIYILNNELIILDLITNVKLSIFDDMHAPNSLQCGIYGSYI